MSCFKVDAIPVPDYMRSRPIHSYLALIMGAVNGRWFGTMLTMVPDKIFTALFVVLRRLVLHVGCHSS